MKSIILIFLGLVFLSCEIPEHISYSDNPLDINNPYRIADPFVLNARFVVDTVILSWTKLSISGFDGYKIYRSEQGGDKQLIATIKNKKETEYEDKKIEREKIYTYFISAYSAADKAETAFDNVQSVKVTVSKDFAFSIEIINSQESSGNENKGGTTPDQNVNETLTDKQNPEAQETPAADKNARFTISGSLVTDKSTKLNWPISASDTKMTWEEAQLFCLNSTFADSTNWRLPTQEELERLRYPNSSFQDEPSFDNVFLHIPKDAFYWTSSGIGEYKKGIIFAQKVTFQNADETIDPAATEKGWVLCVY